MKVDTLKSAIAEAERFLKVARRVKIDKDQGTNGLSWFHVKAYTKESAACRRASMDLSRALSALRKP